MDLASNDEESAILKKNVLMWFLVDNERKQEKLKLPLNNGSKNINTESYSAKWSRYDFTKPSKITIAGMAGLNYKVVNDNRLFKGRVQLIPENRLIHYFPI